MSMLLLFARIGDQAIAFDATTVEAVVDLGEVVPVPFSPPHILGLAAVRSDIVTVIDCGVALGRASSFAGRRAILISSGGMRYALAVSSADDVRTANGSTPTDLQSVGERWAAVTLDRVDCGEGFALRLDPSKIVAGLTRQ